ncbi:MAG: DUF86 domain-containing protein [Bacteroidetes bacterium]|nr:DUF86 domain-containing protein [Bacteroidota bacterium]
MDEKHQKWLYDIKVSIQEIEGFLEEHGKIYEIYKNNLLLKKAIERNLEIIGEAVNRIIKEDPNIRIENAKSIIGLRNFIIHSYDNITDETIWAIVINHLPKLKTDVLKLLKEE